MKHRLLVRRISLLIYGNELSDNYTASCQITINGTHGTIDSLVGSDFYIYMKETGFSIFKGLGLTQLEATVKPAHLRLLKRNLRNTNIEIIENETVTNPIELVWIMFKEKAP